MRHVVECVCLFHVRLALLVVTALLLLSVGNPTLQVSSPAGSPLVVVHRLELILLPLLGLGWLAVWRAGRVLRAGRGSS